MAEAGGPDAPHGVRSGATGDEPRTGGGPAPGGSAPLVGIGRVAADTGTSERTLRYYEELDLIRPAAHRAGGRRLYGPPDVERVKRIRELQDLMGFNLEEIRTILSAEDRLDVLRGRYRSATGNRGAVVREAIAVLEDLQGRVDAKLAGLQAFRAQLDARLERLLPRIGELGRTGQGRAAGSGGAP